MGMSKEKLNKLFKAELLEDKVFDFSNNPDTKIANIKQQFEFNVLFFSNKLKLAFYVKIVYRTFINRKMTSSLSLKDKDSLPTQQIKTNIDDYKFIKDPYTYLHNILFLNYVDFYNFIVKTTETLGSNKNFKYHKK